nr:MAG TPA: hypothetical protein [Caudoviricetes sp.]DAJ63738.1 MAG TPA: hypothetical protein [Caudoviricetes sp.]DAM09061.1 MAG TPA: hypothetical protein [Caudoviricetes sp.]DAZ05822.1 MAG TPA: hypothetical protein [Caudoviricetes sp.]DAZ63487.1 MAG TPA: hypothetical protein [Caudoviricetes sp.]
MRLKTLLTDSFPYWAIRAFTAFFLTSVIDLICWSLSLNVVL